MRVPAPADRHIIDFARSIRADSLPRLVPVVTVPDAEKMDCFANVRRVVERAGGRIVYGWSIWEWARIYVEAEHHAIYQNLKGEWIDVTPTQFQGVAHTLFLPDNSAIYDFNNEGVRRHNHRKALHSDPLIKQLFATKEKYDDLQNAIPGVGLVDTDFDTFRKIKAIEAENKRITLAIARKHLGRNDICFCGSIKKYKKCHGGSH